MSQHLSQHARNLVVMLTAGGGIEDILEMAKSFGVRAIHIQQLAVPPEERMSQRILVDQLKYNSEHI